MELAPVLRDVAAILSGSLPSSTRVTFDLPDEPILVVANPAQITQLLLNLAVNANDALEGEPGRISVRLRHQPPGWRGAEGDQIPAADRRGHEFSFGALDPAIGYASIRVSDNGKGMRPEVMSRIFEPFFTTKERGKGTGLGLSIVHGIVASHQGAYRVESRVNGGTTITIHLPAEAGAAMIGDEAGVVADSRGRERILVIDDEIDLTDVLSIGLERLGYEVGSVNNPNEALAIFAEEPDAWDVVITDQVMPDMKGTSLMPRLKALNPRVKIILTTGFSDGVSVEVAKLSGADGFLAKPSEVSRFAKLVRELLAAPPLE